MYYWAIQIDTATDLKHELKVLSPHTIVDWRNFCCDICALYFVNNPQKIGGMSRVIYMIKSLMYTLGPGHIVEIDESAFGKSKYNKGRFIKTQWVFGGIDITTRECFLVEVDQRDAATLLPIIEQYILPGNVCNL